jgi:hypothetical protein
MTDELRVLQSLDMKISWMPLAVEVNAKTFSIFPKTQKRTREKHENISRNINRRCFMLASAEHSSPHNARLGAAKLGYRRWEACKALYHSIVISVIRK